MAGKMMNGVKMNGVEMNGVKMNGVKMNGVEMNGVKMNGVETRGREWIRPDLPMKCTYYNDGLKQRGKTTSSVSDSPHRHLKREDYVKPKILPNILHQINNTPLVRINKIGKSEGLKCEILAKCEFFNAGGSVKDRIGLRMVEDAEASGKLHPGDVLIEPTSGNTGIGLALTAAVKGYRCIIVMPQKMSNEKVNVLKALGAEIVRTPTSAGFDSPESHLRVADRMNQEIENSHILDQHRNASNAIAHYDSTAEEILEQCDGRLDMVVCGVGTGGTITGISRKIKEKCPTCKVIGVDPFGSILAEPDELNRTNQSFYEVEGLGFDFIPTVLDRSVVDRWYKCSDKPTFQMAKRLIREEGLLCGGSSGAVMYCAIQAAKDFDLKEGQRMVVLLPDSIRNYMTKFVSEDWLRARSLIDEENETMSTTRPSWCYKRVRDVLHLKSTSIKHPLTVGRSASVASVLKVMTSEKVDQIPIVDDDSMSLLGVISSADLLSGLTNGKYDSKTTVQQLLTSAQQFKKVSVDDTLDKLSAWLNIEPYVVAVSDESTKKGVCAAVSGLISRLDLVNFIAGTKQIINAEQ